MATSLSSLSNEDLVSRVFAAERQLVAGRFQHSLNQLENTASLGFARKEIARLRTEIRNREAAAGVPKNSFLSTYRVKVVASATSGGGAEENSGFLQGIVDKLSGNE